MEDLNGAGGCCGDAGSDVDEKYEAVGKYL